MDSLLPSKNQHAATIEEHIRQQRGWFAILGQVRFSQLAGLQSWMFFAVRQNVTRPVMLIDVWNCLYWHTIVVHKQIQQHVLRCVALHAPTNVSTQTFVCVCHNLHATLMSCGKLRISTHVELPPVQYFLLWRVLPLSRNLSAIPSQPQFCLGIRSVEYTHDHTIEKRI